MYAKIENNQVIEYPYDISKIRKENPQTSYPAHFSVEFLKNLNIHLVVSKGQPSFNKITQKIIEIDPVFNAVKNQWEQNWQVVSNNQSDTALILEKIQQEVIEATQLRLDTFAQTKGYDGILSLCTYALSSKLEFQSDGQYGMAIRDATWYRLHEILNEINTNQRPIPQSFSEIEPDLPALNWPT